MSVYRTIGPLVFLFQNIDCGYSLDSPQRGAEAVLTCTHNLCFEQIRGMAEKFVDTISIFNRKRNSVKMNISGFAKIFHEQIDEFL